MTRVAIVNVTGYAGVELARLLHTHPEVQLTCVTGRSSAGQPLGDVFPHLRDVGIEIVPEIEGSVDVVFSALPHAASAAVIGPTFKDGVLCIDLSADFRLRSQTEYQSWYGVKHAYPNLIGMAVYGLPELHRDQIASTRLVANPGCYPTGAILGLAPAIKEGLVNGSVIVDAKSGLSGAGRTSNIEYNFSEVNDSVKAYGLNGHRHVPEMQQELGDLSPNGAVSITFVPHLVPMTRGILSTCYGQLVKNASQKDVQDLYKEFYLSEPFASVVSEPPSTKQTWGNNHCLIYPKVREKEGRIVVLTVLDNLVKGAAGAAVQNMNIMLGLPETVGLEGLAVYP